MKLSLKQLRSIIEEELVRLTESQTDKFLTRIEHRGDAIQVEIEYDFTSGMPITDVDPFSDRGELEITSIKDQAGYDYLDELPEDEFQRLYDKVSQEADFSDDDPEPEFDESF